MSNVADFRKDIRAAFIKSLKDAKTSLTKATPQQIGEELTKLMNDETWQQRFDTVEQFTVQFRTAFKAEIVAVAQADNAALEQIEAIASLPSEATEVVMAVAADEPVAEVVAEVAPAADEPVVMQIVADEVPTAEEELTKPFYVVELQAKEAVAVGFGDVDTARKYGRRRNTSDSVLNQVATRDQYRDRYKEDSMLFKFNLLDKPYRIGEMTPASWDRPKPVAAAKPVAPVKAAPAAPKAAPVKNKGEAKAATPSAPAGAAAPAGGTKTAASLMKRLPIPAEGAAPAQVFSARLSHLESIEQFHALMLELAEANHQLKLKATSKAFEYLSHHASETYADGVCLCFRSAGSDTQKVERKVYLHALARYYEVGVTSK